METIPHGGRLIAARRRWPGAPEPFVDLSTGINPVGYPFGPVPDSVWRRLPEPEELAGLEAVAARAYGAADPAMVVAAPGTQPVLQLLPVLFPLTGVVIPGPTYGEHAAAWRGAGVRVHEGGLTGADAAVICNPNNPDGRRTDVGALPPMRLLVVDEAFADFEPGVSAIPLLPRPGLVVLRSFGKAYGLAGVRLGFAVADPATASRLRMLLGPWAVSGPAIAIGGQALRDAAWREAAGRVAHGAAGRLDAVLRGAGLRVLGGTALFRLAEAGYAEGLAERLGRDGILVRRFDYARSWLRFGLPPDEDAWDRLACSLSSYGAYGRPSPNPLPTGEG